MKNNNNTNQTYWTVRYWGCKQMYLFHILVDIWIYISGNVCKICSQLQVYLPMVFKFLRVWNLKNTHKKKNNVQMFHYTCSLYLLWKRRIENQRAELSAVTSLSFWKGLFWVCMLSEYVKFCKRTNFLGLCTVFPLEAVENQVPFRPRANYYLRLAVYWRLMLLTRKSCKGIYVCS